MKFHKYALGLIAVTVISVTSLAGIASAHNFRSGDNVSLGQNQTVDDTLFIAGRTIDVGSTVNGDVFCAGQTVTVSGDVNGDIICAAQTITITGSVKGDVRLAGQTVSISSEIGGNATIASQSFTLSTDGTIKGDITIGATDTTINGVVERDLAATGDNLVVSNKIGRNISGTVDKIRLTDNARVEGYINYTSGNDLQRDTGASVSGMTTRTEPPRESKTDYGTVFGFSFGMFVYCFIALLAAAMAVALLIPGILHRSSDKVTERPFKAPLIGFAASFIMPIVILVLALTVIGIPLALVLLLSWIIVLALSGAFFAYLIGRTILRQSTRPLLIMLAGASLLVVLYFIPIIGLIAAIAAVWTGSGMILQELWDRRTPFEYNLSADSGRDNKRR